MLMFNFYVDLSGRFSWLSFGGNQPPKGVFNPSSRFVYWTPYIWGGQGRPRSGLVIHRFWAYSVLFQSGALLLYCQDISSLVSSFFLIARFSSLMHTLRYRYSFFGAKLGLDSSWVPQGGARGWIRGLGASSPLVIDVRSSYFRHWRWSRGWLVAILHLQSRARVLSRYVHASTSSTSLGILYRYFFSLQYILFSCGLVSSISEGIILISGGFVFINGTVISDPLWVLSAGDVLQLCPSSYYLYLQLFNSRSRLRSLFYIYSSRRRSFLRFFSLVSRHYSPRSHWLLRTITDFLDVRSIYEVDYMSLSVVVLPTPLYLDIVPLFILSHFWWHVPRSYNWRYYY